MSAFLARCLVDLARAITGAFTNAPAEGFRPRSLGWVLVLSMTAGTVLLFPNRVLDGFHPEALILILYPAILILLCRLWLDLVAGGLSFDDRRLPSLAVEQETIRVELALRYRGILPLGQMELVDHLPAVDILCSPEVLVSSDDLDPTGRLTCSYRVLLNRGYGDFRIGPLEATLHDPLYLFSRKISLGSTTPLKVCLDPTPEGDLDLVQLNALTPMGDSRAIQAGSSMEFFGLKEYVPGEDIRTLCWAKMAQTGRPVVRMFERDTHAEFLLVLHTVAREVKGFGFGNTLKRMIRLAAGALGAVRREGLTARVILPLEGEARLLRVPPTMAMQAFLFDLLAHLEGDPEDRLSALLAMAAGAGRPGQVVVVFTHTLRIPLDPVLQTLFLLKARQAKVALWAMDDSAMVRFQEDQGSGSVRKEDLVERLAELGIECRLFGVKAPPPPEIAGTAAGKILRV